MSELLTIGLISHPSKIMLCVILNQLKAKVEELPAEEEAGFRPGWSTVEQNDLQQLSHHREVPTTPV